MGTERWQCSARGGPGHLVGDDDADDDTVEPKSRGENLADEHAHEGRGSLGVGERGRGTNDSNRDSAEEVGKTDSDTDSKAGISCVLSSLVCCLAVVDVEIVFWVSDWAGGPVGELCLDNDGNDDSINGDSLTENDRNQIL